MTWLKVHDGFHGHPKVEDVPASALGLWVRCGSWATAYLTDGHIPGAIGARFGRKRDADALVSVGLWLPEPGGWVMHDFLDYNPSAQQVRAERTVWRERAAARRRQQPTLFEDTDSS